MECQTKHPSLSICLRWMACLCLLFTLGMSAARAGLTVTINLYHDQYGYYSYGFLNANAALPNFPDGDYLIASPDYPGGGSHLLYTASGGNLTSGINGQYGSGTYYQGFDALLQGITNGTWSIWVTNGATTRYEFQVVISGLSSNTFGLPALVTYPLNNATGIPDQFTFTWTGPANWLGTLDVDVNYTEGGGYSYVDSDSLPPDATSWTPSVSLPAGLNTFSVSYNSNITALVSATTPTNATGDAISGWASNGNLNSRGWSDFTVSGSALNQYLVARYDFEDPDWAGHDSSGNDNDANCGSGNGGSNEDMASPDAAVGNLAREYFGDTSICFFPNGAACFDSLSNALLGSFSWTAWVKTTNSVNEDYANAYFGAPIWFEYADSVNQAVFSITGSKAAFTVGNPDGGSDTTLHSTTSVNDGAYHFLAATRNEASGLMSLYVDGNLEATDISTNGPRIASSTIYLAGGYYVNFAGLLDDVRVYSNELSAADVAALAGNPINNSGSGHTNLAYYSFEDGSLYAYDFSGNDNNIGGYGWFDEPPYLTNDAAAGIYAVGYTGTGWQNPPTNLVATLAGSFTVALWAKTTDEPGSDGDAADWGAGLLSANSDQVIPMAQTGSKLAFLTGGANPDTLHSATSINTGEYVHLVVTRDQNSGQKRIYVNGVLDASDFGSPGVLTSSEDPSLYLGENSSFSGGFLGEMDDVQVYSGVLSDAEVAYLFSHPGTAVADTTGQGSGSDFAAALNTTNLIWSTGGNLSWFTQTAVTQDGLAAQSGPIADNQESWIETTVTGPGSLSFSWRVSSEQDFDYLEFDLDGDWQNDMSGDSGWQQDFYDIPAGTHTLRWIYYKDDSNSDYLDAGFLDEVSYVPAAPSTNTAPVITINPFSQTNYPGYSVALLAAATSNPAATWQWYKVGTGLIPNATSALYLPANSGTAGVNGSYYAVASNLVGSATTLTAAVTFVSAPLPPDWSTAFKSYLLGNTVDRRTNYGICILSDGSGNLYSANSFTGTNTFASDTLIAGGGKFGTALMKQTTSGASLWARGITNTGNGNSYPQSMAAAPGGGVYVSGVFTGTNGLGTNNLIEAAGGTTYLARFDADGNVLWVRTVAGTNFNFQSYHQLVADPAGNVTLSALIQDTVNLGSTNISVSGQRGLLVQYDASGNVRWVQVPSGWVSYMTYNAGCIYGSMGGNATNFIGGLTNTSDRQFALFALTATNGQARWLQNIAAGQGQSTIGDVPAVSVSGTNVFVTGSAGGSNAVFGAFTVSWPANLGQYFARYGTNGTAQLATTFGSPTTMPWAAVADASGNVYVGGDFDTYAVFGGNVIAAPHQSSIGDGFFSQTFVARFDRDGNALWARTAQSTNYFVNLRDLALVSDGIWTYGFVLQSAKFGSFQVFGTTFIISSELQYLLGGAFGKITESTAIPNPITLINPSKAGANFQFQFQSQSGFSHNILYRTNLAVGIWQTNSTISGDGTLKTISLPFSLFSPATQGFIRVSTQ